MLRHSSLLLIVLSILTSMSAGQGAAAQDPEEELDEFQEIQPQLRTATQRNAATWYRAAIQRYRSLGLTQDHLSTVWAFEADISRPPSGQARLVLDRLQSPLVMLRRGSQKDSADFGMDFSQPETVDHSLLSDLRTLTRLMSCELRLRVQEGDAPGTAARLASLYRISRHVNDDPSLLGSLVSTAMLTRCDQDLQAALDHVMVGPAEAADLLRALEGLNADDPSNTIAGLKAESQNVTTFLKRQLDDAEKAQAQQASAPGADLDGAEEGILASGVLETVNEAGGEAEIESFNAFMGAVQGAFASQDSTRAKETVALLASQASDGEHGSMAKLLAPAIDKAYDQWHKTRAQLRVRRIVLTDIASGRLDPASLANAAVWYRRAIARMSDVSTRRMEAVLAFAAVHDAPADQATLEALDAQDVQEILQLLVDGSRLKRCDFGYSLSVWPQTIRPYQVGMRRALRMLLGEAARRLHAGGEADISRSTELIAAANLVCIHLAADRAIVSSLVAHQGFLANDSLTDAGMSANLLQERHALRLAESLQRLNQGDAFGYGAALASERSHVQEWLLEQLPPEQEDAAGRARRVAQACAPDTVLWLMLARDQQRSRRSESGSQPVVDPDDGSRAARILLELATGLDDVLSEEPLGEALEGMEAPMTLIREGAIDDLLVLAAPVIADVSVRQKSALNDLRRGRARFEPVAGELASDPVAEPADETGRGTETEQSPE